MKCWRLPNGRILAVAQADITTVKADAIVNPANSMMIMGGGVAGAIKRAGGEEIEREAMRHAPVPVGEAVVTGAGRLPAKAVIHAPTMERAAMRIPLSNAVEAGRAALRVASQRGFRSIAMPALGAGVGGLRLREVARELARVAAEGTGAPEIVLLVARGPESLEEMLKGVSDTLGSEGVECPKELEGLV